MHRADFYYMFQFHKVQLKGKFCKLLGNIKRRFQFHKVQLKARVSALKD